MRIAPVKYLLAAVLVFGSIAVFGVSATAADTTPAAVGVGFDCVGASSYSQQIALRALQRADVGYVRFYLRWYQLQPSKPPKPYDPGVLARLAWCVNEAQADGMQVLVDVLGTPGWAGKEYSTPPRPTAYAALLGYLANTYKQVSAWEIWNEEDTRRYWQGSAGQYVRLLKASYEAVKEANPAAQVVFGGTEHNDAAWVQACYQAGMQGFFDVMATHPYPRSPDSTDVSSVLGSIQSVYDVMAANGDGDKSVMLTEWGWSRHNVSPGDQAQIMDEALAYIANLPYVSASFWFEAKTVDGTAGPHSWIGGLALLKPTGGVTPAYRALATWNGVEPQRAPSSHGRGRWKHTP